MSKIIKLEDGQLVAEDPDTGERVPVSFEALEAGNVVSGTKGGSDAVIYKENGTHYGVTNTEEFKNDDFRDLLSTLWSETDAGTLYIADGDYDFEGDRIDAEPDSIRQIVLSENATIQRSNVSDPGSPDSDFIRFRGDEPVIIEGGHWDGQGYARFFQSHLNEADDYVFRNLIVEGTEWGIRAGENVVVENCYVETRDSYGVTVGSYSTIKDTETKDNGLNGFQIYGEEGVLVTGCQNDGDIHTPLGFSRGSKSCVALGNTVRNIDHTSNRESGLEFERKNNDGETADYNRSIANNYINCDTGVWIGLADEEDPGDYADDVSARWNVSMWDHFEDCDEGIYINEQAYDTVIVNPTFENVNTAIIDNGVRTRWGSQAVIGGGRLGGADLTTVEGQFDGDRAVSDGTATDFPIKTMATWDGSQWVRADGQATASPS